MEYILDTNILLVYVRGNIVTQKIEEELTDKYAKIDAYSQGKLPAKKGSFTSRNMGKNDLWIAATGALLNATIITTDEDFSHLDGEYIKLKKMNLNNFK